MAKPTFREFLMDVSERLSYVRKNTKKYLFSYLSLVTKKGKWKEVTRVRKQIKSMLEKESMGFVVRSRFKEHLESEKASLFHLNGENKNFSKSSLQYLKIDGQVTNEEAIIEKRVLQYFVLF